MVLNVKIILSAKYGCVLVGIYVILFSTTYYSNIALFLIQMSPSVYIILGLLPILFIHSISPNASSLSFFDFIGHIEQYLLKISIQIIPIV